MATRPTNTTAHTLETRLHELINRFIDRPDRPGLSYEERNRLRASIESEVLFGLLGSFSYAVSADSGALTKTRLFEIVDSALTRAMARESARAADLAPHAAAA